jgi:hypothetical protein
MVSPVVAIGRADVAPKAVPTLLRNPTCDVLGALVRHRSDSGPEEFTTGCGLCDRDHFLGGVTFHNRKKISVYACFFVDFVAARF